VRIDLWGNKRAAFVAGVGTLGLRSIIVIEVFDSGGRYINFEKLTYGSVLVPLKVQVTRKIPRSTVSHSGASQLLGSVGIV
jgi:hypothetical protein